jgi:hypothetical protein
MAAFRGEGQMEGALGFLGSPEVVLLLGQRAGSTGALTL